MNVLETCGNCAAFPCFRRTDKNEKAGFCYQLIRQCRQECDNYRCDGYPAAGGTCRVDGCEVKYDQECHIPDIRDKRNLLMQGNN